MQLAGGASRRREAHGDLLRQVAPQINGRTDGVGCAIDLEFDGQQPGDVFVTDSSHHRLAGGEVLRRRCGVGGCRGVDGVDVDAHMAVADIGVLRIQKGVKLDRNDAAVARAVGEGREEAQAAAYAVGGNICVQVPKEESHTIARDEGGVQGDSEGEGGSEAGHLAGRAIPELQWMHVFGPAGAVCDVLITPVLCQLKSIGGEVGVAGAVDQLREIWAPGLGEGEVEGQGTSGRDMDGQHGQAVVEDRQNEEGGTTTAHGGHCHSV